MHNSHYKGGRGMSFSLEKDSFLSFSRTISRSFFVIFLFTSITSSICNAQELHSDSNAVSIANESNSTTGWGGGAIKAVDSTDPYHGSYAMKLTSTTGATGRYATYTFDAIVGEVYDISLWVKPGSQTDDPGFTGWSGVSGFNVTWITGSGWEEYTFTVVATTTSPEIRVYTGISSGTTGDILYVDKVTIQKNNTEVYTEPFAASKNYESATVGTSWSNSYWLAVESSDVYSGNYALKVGGNNSGTYELSALTLNSIPGETYTIKGYVKANAINEQGMSFVNFTNVSVNSGTTPTTSYAPFTFTGEATGSTFTFQVYGSLGTPSSDYLLLDELSIYRESSDTQSPTAPTLSSTGQTDTTVDLSWSGATDDTGVTGYKVYKGGALEATLGNVNTYQVTGLTASTTYGFTVKALDAAGNESSASNSVSVTTASSSGDTQSPTSPTLTSTGQTNSTVDLSWSGATDDTGVTGYKVYKGGVLETTLGNVSTYQVTGLTASTSYSFTVTALDAAGNESPVSNTVSITTDPGSGGGSGSVWTESGSVASYTGGVAIGATSVPSGYKLAVEGKIRAREIRVDQDNWPDYVFADDYNLPSLEEIKKHIEEKGHLPNIPSSEEVEANGVELGEMNRLLLEKIEELTLHMILQQKLLLEQQKQIQRLQVQTGHPK